MKILARHLFLNLFKPLLYLLVAFTLLFIIGDLMDTAEDFMGAGAGALDLVRYYALRLPSMVIMIVPLCLLLAVLYSLSRLTRHSEITAMRASGISIYRIVRPYLLMGFVCLLATAAVNEYTGPKFAYRADQFIDHLKERSQGKGEAKAYFESISYKNAATGHLWYVRAFDTRRYTMQGVQLYIQRPDGTDLEKYTAAQARWVDGRWWFEDGTIQRYDERGDPIGRPEPFPTREMRRLPEQPNDFMIEIKDPEYQSSLELRNYLASYRKLLSPDTLTKYEVDLHHKLAMPVTCLIVVLLGIPVGAHTGRKGAFAGIMMALGMFFGFYAMQFAMEYLAKQMLIPAWTGPWSAVILFSIVGAVMIHRMR